MVKNKKYTFAKKSIKVLPLQYHYFEKVSSKDSKVLVKWHDSKALMTDKMFVEPFYKFISRVF
jgi:hypothetical protein